MSAQHLFDPHLIRIEQLHILPLYFDFKGSPVERKLQEIIKVKKKRHQENIKGIIREVVEANKCTKVDYKRSGKKRIFWGLYEREPEEKLSISIKGHYCTSA